MICVLKLNRENVFFGAKLANTHNLIDGYFIATDVDDARDRAEMAGDTFLVEHFSVPVTKHTEPGKYRLEDHSSGKAVPYLILVTRS